MCQSKAQGGQRCYNDECPIYKNAIKHGNVDRAKQGGRSLILTPNSIENYNEQGNTLIEENKPVISESTENVVVLEELENKIQVLEEHSKVKNSVPSEKEMEDKLSALQARLEATAIRQENEEYVDNSETYNGTNEEDLHFHNNPDTLMQRVDMPSEHDQILKEKNVDEFYLKRIAETTTDKSIRARALGRYARIHDIDFKQAAANVPESIELTAASRQKWLEEQEVKEVKKVESKKPQPRINTDEDD